ncbi:MAG: sugar phosphate isomerase/epimerase [Acidobacteriota bacterium]|nr:sugar phosphate isomerase/epimerase [Acidobacteriota bacterium]
MLDRMLLGAVTYNVLKDWDIETIIRKLEAAGFEAVELRTGHKHGVEPTLTADERMRVMKRFERSKVRLLSYGTTCEFQSPDANERRKQIAIARTFIDLAHDTGAWGIKVRPNGLPKDVPVETTVANIAASLREVGDYGVGKGVEIWMEVHGRDTQNPPVAAAIMRATKHDSVGVCWNSNPTDVVNGSVKPSFDLLRPWIKNVHINELTSDYPWRELFGLLRKSNYERYTLCEAAESKEPERFLSFYKSLWTELNRACA